MSDNKNKFQVWIEENGYDYVRFYPMNTAAYGVSEMLDSAYSAVVSFENGLGEKYIDDAVLITDEPTI